MWNISNEIPLVRKNQVCIYRIDLDRMQLNEDILSNMPYLSSTEKSRLDKYRFTIDKFRFGIGRIAIRLLCSKQLGIDPAEIHLTFNPYGKPKIVQNKDLQFNISHSGNSIVLGLGIEHEIGVDIEEHNDIIDHIDLAKCVFSESEQNQLLNAQSDKIVEGFYNGWTLKESFIKAMGLGLQIPLDKFSVALFSSNTRNCLMDVEWDKAICSEWISRNFSLKNNYKAAYTCHRSTEKIDYIDITPMVQIYLEKLQQLN